MSIQTRSAGRFLPLVLALSLAGLAGCGSGPLAGPSGANIELMTGIVHGGQSPIQGSTVELYHTNPAATTYGAAGILIGTGTTDVNGNFSITPTTNGTNCPAGTQAYITAAAGYQPNSPSLVNNNMLQMAALGDCSTITSSSFVILNEVTTVAAAYALSSFMTTSIDGSNAFYKANVSAPVANSTSVSSITSTTPAGLAHAFLNAAKLVNYTSGMPNATTPAFSGGGSTAGSVPYTEILTLADMMQGCIDSSSLSNGSVLSAPVTAGGSGYGATIAIGGSGTGAAANAVVTNGVVTGLDLTAGGSGYGPTVTLANNTGGTGATITANSVAGVITGYVVEAAGSGYGPTVTLSAPTAGTTATAVASETAGVITGYVITNGGSGYTSAPTVTVTGNGSTPTTAAAPGAVTISGGAVTAIATGTGGAGYGPTLSIAGSGTGATGTVTVTQGLITSAAVVAGGTGYSPAVTITPTSGSTGSGATGTATVEGGSITALTLTAGGTLYPSPTVTFGAPTAGTLATATSTTVGGALKSINITNGGSGYTTAPTVTLSAPGTGTTATATSNIASDAGSANVAPSTSCNTLFTFTPSLAGNVPNNTLQSFINLARNPYPSAAAMNSASGLLSLATSSSAFQPILTTSPVDWSVSIVYGGTATTASTGTALAAPYWLALDANDTVYVGLSATSTSLPALYGIGSYGVSVPLFGSMTAGTATRGIAPDALGDIWITNNSSGLYKFSASAGGSPTLFTTLASSYDLAVDAANNIWVGHAISSGNNVDEWAYNGTTWAQNYTAALPAGPYGIAVDANQNIWAATYYISAASSISTNAAVLPNLGTAGSPSYTVAGTAITPITALFPDGVNHPYGMVFDASGNAWYDIYGVASQATSGVEEVIPNSTTALTAITPQTFIPGSSAGPNGNILGPTSMVADLGAIDGAGTIFIPDNNSTGYGIHVYNTVSGNVLSPSSGLKSCLLVSTATTTCGGTSAAAIYNPRETAVDSTGSVWAGVTSGGITQTIGVAAPAYPLLSVGKPGLSPGLSAVNPLP